VTQTLFQWNPMSHLKEFELKEATNLSVVAVNVVIQVPILPKVTNIGLHIHI
jgi:hypothetical protein